MNKMLMRRWMAFLLCFLLFAEESLAGEFFPDPAGPAPVFEAEESWDGEEFSPGGETAPWEFSLEEDPQDGFYAAGGEEPSPEMPPGEAMELLPQVPALPESSLEGWDDSTAAQEPQLVPDSTVQALPDGSSETESADEAYAFGEGKEAAGSPGETAGSLEKAADSPVETSLLAGAAEEAGEELVFFTWDDEEEEQEQSEETEEERKAREEEEARKLKEERKQRYSFDPDFGKLTLKSGVFDNQTIYWDDEEIGGREMVREVEAREGVSITVGSGLFENLVNCYLIDLHLADTSSARSFYKMFYQCTALQEVKLSGFDTSSVTNMEYMFAGCASLSRLDLSSFDVAACEYRRTNMFLGCDRLSRLTLPIGFYVGREMALNNGYGGKNGIGWVVEMGDSQVLSEKGSVAYLNPAPEEITTFVWKSMEDDHAYGDPEWNWQIHKAGIGASMTMDAEATVSFQCMFCEQRLVLKAAVVHENEEKHYTVLKGTVSLQEREYTDRKIVYKEPYYMDDTRPGVLILDYGTYDKDFIDWDAEWLVTTLDTAYGVQEEDKEYIYGRDAIVSIDATENVVFAGDCTGLFASLPCLQSVSLADSTVRDGADLTRFLADCPELTSIESMPQEGSPASVRGMYKGSTSLTEVNLAGFDTRQTTDFSEMFMDCTALTKLNLSYLPAESASTFSWMFAGCTRLERIRNLPAGSYACTDFSHLFEGCTSLRQVDISELDTSGALTLENMYAGCESLEAATGAEKLSVGTVQNFHTMFKGCMGLREADLSAWDVGSAKNLTYLFTGCRQLREVRLFSGSDLLERETPVWGMFEGTDKLSSLYLPADVKSLPPVLYLNLGDPSYRGWTLEGAGVREISREKPLQDGSRFYGTYAEIPEGNLKAGEENHILWRANANHVHAYGGLFWEWEEDYSKAKAVQACACGSRLEYPARVVVGAEMDYVQNIQFTATVGKKLVSKKLTIYNFPFSYKDGTLTLKAGRTIEPAQGISGWEQILEKYKTNPEGLTISQKKNVARYLSWWEEVERDEVTRLEAEPGARLVGDLTGFFSQMPKLKEADLSGADISGLTDISALFSEDVNLEKADLSSWRYEKGDASSLFSGCQSLKEILLPSCFAPTRAHFLFEGCSSLEEADFTNCVFAHGSDITGGFTGCSSLRKLTVPAGFEVMPFMELSNANPWVLYGGVGDVISGQERFASMSQTREPTIYVWKKGYVPIYQYDEENQVLTLNWGTYRLETINWHDWREKLEKLVVKEGVVFVGNMAGFLAGAENLTSVNLAPVDFSLVTDLSSFFKDCTSLKNVDMSGMDLSQVSYLSQMFSGCTALEELNFKDSTFGTIYTMDRMFERCSSLRKIDLSFLDVQLVENIERLFLECYALEQLSLPDFRNGLIRNMQHCFDGCHGLKTMDLSRLDTRHVTAMDAAFADCPLLTELDLSGLDIGSTVSMRALVKNDTGLKTLLLPEMSNLDAEAGEVTMQVSGALEGLSSLRKLEAGPHFAIPKEMMLQNGSPDKPGWVIDGGSGEVVSGRGDYADISPQEGRFTFTWALGYEKPYHFDAQSGILTFKAGAVHAGTLRAFDFDRAQVKEIQCSGMVYLTGDVSGFFADMRALKKLDLSAFDFERAENLSGIFTGLSSLEELTVPRNLAITREMGLENVRGDYYGGFVQEGGEEICSGEDRFAVLEAAGRRMTYLYRYFPFYTDEEGNTRNAPVDAPLLTEGVLSGGWYAAEGSLTLSALTAEGDVKVILCDGCSLTITGGIHIAEGSSLTLYGQEEEGELKVLSASSAEGTGSLLVKGGKVTLSSFEGEMAVTAGTLFLGSLTGGLLLDWKRPLVRVKVEEAAPEATLAVRGCFTDLSEPGSLVTAENIRTFLGRELLSASHVRFDSAGGSPVADAVVPADGIRAIPRPGDPQKSGESLKAWLLDGEPYDFSLPAGRSEYLLTALWEKKGAGTEEEPAFRFTSFALALGGELGLYFYLTLPGEEKEYQDSYLEFTLNQLTQKVPFSEAELLEEGVYGFPCRLNVAQMADEITAVFHHGETQGTITYSLAEYLAYFRQHSSSFDEETVALANAVADYGHYCQPFLAKYNGWTIGIDHAPMAAVYSISEEDIERVRQEVSAYEDVREEEAGSLYYSLALRSKPTLTVYYRSGGETSSVRAFVDGAERTVEKAVKDQQDTYFVRIPDIPMDQADVNHEVVFEEDGKQAKICLCPLSYVQMELEEAFSHGREGMEAVVSLYRYYEAVTAYLHGKT